MKIMKQKGETSTMRSYSLNKNICDSDVRASTFGIFFVLLSTCVLALAIFINHSVPEPLNAQNGKLASSQCLLRRFDARRVLNDLEELSSIGPKVAGTYENEVVAVNFLTDKINEILNGTKTYANKAEFHVQQSKGCFAIKKTLSCYDKIQNIVVRLKSEVLSTSEYILVNCHFDSAPTSPGTSDDGLHCAVMLEMLRVLISKDEPLKKNVLFLFNGAEEDGLLASHGFITQDIWAKNITSFINLEACGAGGREILFQTGPRAYVLPKVYAESVPYPYGNVIGEELFQTGILPSDTDFRIFRDYGHLKGLDFAHYKNGYVYHTSSDNVSFVSTSVIQHTGSNILTLLQNLIDKEDLKSLIEEDDEQAVFFDILGKFMVCYSMVTAFRINMTVVVISVVMSTFINIKIFRQRKVKSLSYHYALNLMFLGFGVFLISCIQYGLVELLKWKQLTMLWYSQPWFAAIYYGIPPLFAITSIVKLRRTCFYSTITLEEEVLIFSVIPQIILTLFLLTGTLLGVRTSYVLVIKLVPLCISFFINYTLLRKGKVSRRILVHVICNLVSFFYMMYLVVPFYQLLIPMMGRMGVTTDTELFMAIMCQLVALGSFLFFIPLVLFVRNYWKIQVAVFITYVTFSSAVLFGSILKPFGDNTPERFEILHTSRKLIHPGNVSKTESNGFFLIPVDPRGPEIVNSVFKEYNFTNLNKFCETELFCGLPLTKQSMAHNNFQHSLWSPASKPAFPYSKNLTVVSIEQKNNMKSFYFEAYGPSLSQFILQPLSDSELIEWSFYHGKPFSSMAWNDEIVFVINQIRGSMEDEFRWWNFSFTFDISKMENKNITFKLSWAAHYRTNNADYYDADFKKILRKFPSWTRVTSWITDLEEYLF